MSEQYQRSLSRPSLALDQLIEGRPGTPDGLDEHLFITEAFMQLYYHPKAPFVSLKQAFSDLKGNKSNREHELIKTFFLTNTHVNTSFNAYFNRLILPWWGGCNPLIIRR